MKRKYFLAQLSNPYTAPSRYNRSFKTGDPGDGGFDLSTKEGAEAFLKKNTEIVLELKEVKEGVGAAIAVKNLSKTVKELETKVASMPAGLEFKESKEYKDMVAELKQTGLDLNALRDSNRSGMQFKKGTIAKLLQDNDAKIKSFLSTKGAPLMLEYKAFEDATSIGSNDSFNTVGRDAYFTWHEGGMVGRLPVRRPFMRELFTSVTTGTEWIKYIDQATVVRNASNVAYCGTTTSNTAVTWKVSTVEIQKVRDFMDICLDMMSDYGFVQGEINRLLNESLDLQIDSQLVVGNGIGPQLFGLASIASTFSATSTFPGATFAGLVPSAQIIDLISVAGAQIRIFGQQNMYFPDNVLMNPADVQAIKFLKNSFGDYIRNNQLIASIWQDQNGTYYVDGMRIVENPLIAQNTLYIGDFRKGTVYSKPGIGIEFAYENRSNFETETVTVKIYERLNLIVRTVDKNAFMFVQDITAAIAAINKTVTP